MALRYFFACGCNFPPFSNGYRSKEFRGGRLPLCCRWRLLSLLRQQGYEREAYQGIAAADPRTGGILEAQPRFQKLSHVDVLFGFGQNYSPSGPGACIFRRSFAA